MKKLILWWLAGSGLLFTGCATLTKTQIATVDKLCLSGDTLAAVPSAWISTLAQVRRERGLYYVASLEQADLQAHEMEALWKASLVDAALVQKIDAYVGIFNAYTRALGILAHPRRWKHIGVEMRGLGRKADSVLMAYNTLGWTDKVLVGVGKEAGRVAGYLGEQYMKRRQRKILCEVVAVGDTLVASCCAALSGLLKSEEAKFLSDNEMSGLRDNYLSFVKARERGAIPYVRSDDALYFLLCDRVKEADRIRSRCAAALTRFATAHHKLREQLEKGGGFPYKELMDLNGEMAGLRDYVAKIFNNR